MTDESPPKNDDSPFSLSINLEFHFENMAEFEAVREEYEALTAVKRKSDIDAFKIDEPCYVGEEQAGTRSQDETTYCYIEVLGGRVSGPCVERVTYQKWRQVKICPGKGREVLGRFETELSRREIYVSPVCKKARG